MNPEQLQEIKEHFENVPEGWTVNEGAKIIEQMKEDGMALIAKVERMQALLSEWKKDCVDLYEENRGLKSAFARRTKALEFYADEKNYNRITLSILTAKVLLDNGELARKALEGTK